MCWTCQPHPMGINDACTMHVRMSNTELQFQQESYGSLFPFSQALDSSNMQGVATKHQQRCQSAWESFPRRWALWARQNLGPEEWAAVQRMGHIWGALGSGVQLHMSCLQEPEASAAGSMWVAEACSAQEAPGGSAHFTATCAAQQAPPGNTQETVASVAQQALEHDGCAGVQPAHEAGCSPIAPTHVSTAAEGCGEPLNELEDRRMAEADEERDARQVCFTANICASAHPGAC